ncbi:MAG TPA: lanthionine synthetase LanC family protein [Bryobacteraceae bacterium]|nr:lanthionine synthetase LanC family protein [Bryobacteraceae bacterium]
MSRTDELSVAEIFSATLQKFGDTLHASWEIVDWLDGSVSWRLFRLRDAALPSQGWKVHVSAAATEAFTLFSSVAPLLIELGASFKIARALKDIVHINSGDGGAMQAGKVITVYPLDDPHAARIAGELDRIWPVSRGPEVQTDLHVRPGSAVSLRYGLFEGGATVISSSGVYESALSMPDGTLVPDTRRAAGKQADMVPPPPLPCCAPRSLPLELNQPLEADGKHYVPLALLRESPRAKTFLGIDSSTWNTVVLKVGLPGMAGDLRGLDIGDKLQKEFQILSKLAECHGLAPKPVGWIGGEFPILIMEDFRGDPVSELPLRDRLACLLPLARAVERLHQAGFVHGDIKLENAIRRNEAVGLIDFELAERAGDMASTGGTPGYMAPEVETGCAAAFPRDIFALGACVAQAVLGVPPALLPEGAGRLRGLLSMEGAPVASRLVRSFARVSAASRPTATEAAAMIEKELDDLQITGPSKGVPSSEADLNWCRRASAEAGALTASYSVNDAAGLCWRNEHFMRPFHCEGINLGAAGILLGLITIEQALGRRGFTSDIDRAAQWLASRSPESTPAGLFTGNAGVALALVVSGRRLKKEEYIAAGRMRLRCAVADERETDLFSGAAGVLFTCCLLSDVVAERWPLDMGRAAERVLCIRSGSGTPYLGCAHGAAGSAMAQACWGRRAGDERFLDAAVETFHRIFAQGRTADGSALRMTQEADRAHAAGNWCHGVAGYLWCILQAFGDHPDLREEIDWAVGAVRNSMTAGTPTYCHGLAGRLELWRMVATISRHRELALAQAGKAARALRLLHHKREGKIAWCSDDPAITTPDLWIGFLGPASALAMHAAHDNAALLSGNWLQRCAGA